MKVMTYNVHSCLDARRENSLERIAELIKRERPAVIGFNEIESFSPRTRFVNQPKLLALSRDLAFCFGPTIRFGPLGFFGNAVLSRYPIIKNVNYRLPGKREPRCCLLIELRVKTGYLTVISTHLGLNRNERTAQIAKLVQIVSREKNPVILMGDFNCGTDQLTPLYEMLTDTGMLFGSKPTYPCDNPVDRIDYILISPQIVCRELYSPFDDSSDHLPVLAELEF